MLRISPLLLTGCLALTAVSGQAVQAATAGPIHISVQPVDAHGRPLQGPGYFAVSMRPGHHAQLYARISNTGKTTVTLALLPVDTQRAPDGNISYDLPGAPRRRVGAWVRLSAKSLRLHAGRSRVVTLGLQIPASARPATYVGALTVYVPTSGSASGRGAVIDVQTRLAVAIVVTLRAAGTAHG